MPSTPGPWDQEYVVAGENRGALIIKSVAGQVHVATIEDDGGVPGADEANGKLIAAAPELLAGLSRLAKLVAKVNASQHAGLPIQPGDWSDLYQATGWRSGPAKVAGEAAVELLPDLGSQGVKLPQESAEQPE